MLYEIWRMCIKLLLASTQFDNCVHLTKPIHLYYKQASLIAAHVICSLDFLTNLVVGAHTHTRKSPFISFYCKKSQRNAIWNWMHRTLKAVSNCPTPSPTNGRSNKQNNNSSKKESLYASFDFIWPTSQFSYTFMWSIDGFSWFYALVPWETIQHRTVQSFKSMSVKCDTRRLLFFFSWIRVFFCGARTHPTFNWRLFAFGQKRRGRTHSHLISRAFTWLLKDFIDDSLCPRWSRKWSILYTCMSVCVRHTILAHWILMVWSTYRNLILEMLMKTKELIWNKYISWLATEKRTRSEKEKVFVFLMEQKRSEQKSTI